MSFFKPRIFWTAKPIKGDVTIGARGDTKSPAQGGTTSVPPKDSFEYANPAPPADQASTVRVRDNFPKAEQDVIDHYLTVRDQVFDDLALIDRGLDDRLKSIAIPYDAKDFPLLSAAHKCPYCGNPSAANVITYDDIKQKRAVGNAINQAVGSQVLPNNFAGMNPQQVAASQEKMFAKLLAEMLTQVWKQVLIWILEVIYKLLRPLENVPFAGAIPAAIKSLINALKGKKTDPKDTATADDYYVNAASVDDYYATIDNTSKMASLGGIYRACVMHQHDFNNGVDNLILGDAHEPFLRLRDANDQVRASLRNVDTVTGAVIPPLYEYDNYKTTGLKYVNPSSEEYLRARQDGKGVQPSLIIAAKAGTQSVFDNANREWISTVKTILTGWWESTDTLCCIINNILRIGGLRIDASAGRALLLTIRSLLALYRNYLSFDMKQAVSDLFNLIMSLINTVFTALIGGLANLLQSEVNRFLTNNDLTSILRFDTPCLPWNDMVLSFGRYVKFFTEEFFSMLMDFISQAQLVNVKAGVVAKKAEETCKIDNWISLIDNVIRFLRVWDFCVQNGSDPRNYLRTQDAQDYFSAIAPTGLTPTNEQAIRATLQNLAQGTTTSNIGNSSSSSPTLQRPGQPVARVVTNFDAASGGTAADSGADITWKIDEPGMRILLTNYLGLSESAAETVLSDTGDCACDKTLTDEELLIIREALLKRSANG